MKKIILVLCVLGWSQLDACLGCARMIKEQDNRADIIIDQVVQYYPETDPTFIEGYRVGLHRGYSVSLFCMSLTHPEYFQTLEGDQE